MFYFSSDVELVSSRVSWTHKGEVLIVKFEWTVDLSADEEEQIRFKLQTKKDVEGCEKKTIYFMIMLIYYYYYFDIV